MKAKCSSCGKSKLATSKPRLMGTKSTLTSKTAYASPKVSISFGRKK